MADVGAWTIDGGTPRRVPRAGVGLESHLEDWIARDAGLLADGLTIVGRQLHLDGGFLDLLAIDWPDRWVVSSSSASASTGARWRRRSTTPPPSPGWRPATLRSCSGPGSRRWAMRTSSPGR